MYQHLRSSKSLIFIAIMGALGNVISFVSIAVSPMVSSVPLGPISFSLALDLSHITTFIAALFGGPVTGGLTGMIGGLIAAYQFGFSQGNFVTGFGLPLGKALTGVTAGLVMKALGLPGGRRALLVPSTISSYLPEGAYTALLFALVFPAVFGLPSWMANLIALQIVVKALVEMVVMGVILGVLLRNQGFTAYIKGFFA